VNLQLSASDPAGLVLSYSISGLPPGLTLGTGNGAIFGTPNTPGAYTVTATVTNTSSLSASQTFTWTILSQPSSGVPGGVSGGTPTGGGTPAPTPVPGPDVTPPNVTVGSPSQAGGSTRTINSRIIVTGAASDNVGVVSVTWANSRGGSGAALGTTSWSAGPIELQMGDNIITITAVDMAGNAQTASVTVTLYVEIQNQLN
jgi:hypothetical protein